MWWLLCQGTEFLFFTLNGYCKSSQSSETLSTCLNGSQGTECSVGTVHVFMKALPSQVRAAEFQLVSASLLPQHVSEHMCSSSALPASQPPVQDVPCPLKRWLLRARHLCKHTYFPLQNSCLNYSQGGIVSNMRHCGILVAFGCDHALCRLGWKPAADDVTWEWEWVWNLGGMETDCKPQLKWS